MKKVVLVRRRLVPWYVLSDGYSLYYSAAAMTLVGGIGIAT